MNIWFYLSIFLSCACGFFSYKFFQLSKKFKRLSEEYHDLIEQLEAFEKILK